MLIKLTMLLIFFAVMVAIGLYCRKTASDVNGFVLGDECTNLLQPLYVIPALSVVGMKLKDVWGFMAFICVFWVVITCLGLYFIPMFV